MVLDLLEEGKISVAQAEVLLFAMQPQDGRRPLLWEQSQPDTISVLVDSAQANPGEVLNQLGRAFALKTEGEVN
jgi:hypothetical protein